MVRAIPSSLEPGISVDQVLIEGIMAGLKESSYRGISKKLIPGSQLNRKTSNVAFRNITTPNMT